MNKFVGVVLGLGLGCSDKAYEMAPLNLAASPDAGVDAGSSASDGGASTALGQTRQELSAFGFYGVRRDGANNQRLCASVPGPTQLCYYPSQKRVRVNLVTTGMTSGDSQLATQWVTAIIDNTFNKAGGKYEPTGFTWQQTIHQPAVTIKKGVVDDSLGADNTDIRRYLRLSCDQSTGALTENPAKDGSYFTCTFWNATIDLDKMRTYKSDKMSQMIHHTVAVAMLAPAGIGVGTITAGLVTQQTLATSGFLITVVSDRDLCAMTKFVPTNDGTVNFVGGC